MTTALRSARAMGPADPAVIQFVTPAKECCRLFDRDDIRMRRGSPPANPCRSDGGLTAPGLALPDVDPEVDTEEPFLSRGRRQFRITPQILLRRVELESHNEMRCTADERPVQFGWTTNLIPLN